MAEEYYTVTSKDHTPGGGRPLAAATTYCFSTYSLHPETTAWRQCVPRPAIERVSPAGAEVLRTTFGPTAHGRSDPDCHAVDDFTRTHAPAAVGTTGRTFNGTHVPTQRHQGGTLDGTPPPVCVDNCELCAAPARHSQLRRQMSASDILHSMADTLDRVQASTDRSRTFNPYDINLLNGRGARSESSTSIGDDAQTANWRVPRTHDLAAEREAAHIRHAAEFSAAGASVDVEYSDRKHQRPIVGHGKWSATSPEYFAALRR